MPVIGNCNCIGADRMRAHACVRAHTHTSYDPTYKKGVSVGEKTRPGDIPNRL